MNNQPFDIDQFDFEWHLAERVRGAGQAGVEGADGDLDVVEQAFGDFVAVQVAPGDVADGFVHRLVVIGRRHNEVGHRDQVVFIDAVMVEQCAARRLDDADAFHPTFALDHQVAAEQVVVMQQFLDDFRGVQHFDHPRPVVGERRVHRRAAGVIDELLALVLGEGRRNLVAVLDAGQRADLVPAIFLADGFEEGELHVAPRPHFFLDVLVVLLVIDVVEEDLAVVVAGAQGAVIEVEIAVVADDGHEIGAEDAEAVVQPGVLRMDLLDQMNGFARPLDDVVNVLEQLVAFGTGSCRVDAAGTGAGALDALAGRDADDFLAEAAQQHAALGRFRMGHGDADDVALGHIAVEAEEQVRRTEVEEVQRVRLQHLAVVHQATHLFRRRRQFFGADDDIERLGGGQMVRHRADAAQALDHDRHFPIRPALDEFLEAAKFDDVQAHLMHFVLVVEQDGDFAVAFNPRHWVDGDTAQGFGVGRSF